MYPYDEYYRQFGFPGQMFPPGGQYFPSPGGMPFPGGPSTQPGPGGAAAPSGPPPAITPQKPDVSLYAVDPGAIYGCLYKFTYIWTTFGRSFWAYLTFVGPRSVAGYRWIGYRWVYFSLDLNLISYSQCY